MWAFKAAYSLYALPNPHPLVGLVFPHCCVEILLPQGSDISEQMLPPSSLWLTLFPSTVSIPGCVSTNIWLDNGGTACIPPKPMAFTYSIEGCLLNSADQLPCGKLESSTSNKQANYMLPQNILHDSSFLPLSFGSSPIRWWIFGGIAHSLNKSYSKDNLKKINLLISIQLNYIFS